MSNNKVKYWIVEKTLNNNDKDNVNIIEGFIETMSSDIMQIKFKSNSFTYFIDKKCIFESYAAAEKALKDNNTNRFVVKDCDGNSFTIK